MTDRAQDWWADLTPEQAMALMEESDRLLALGWTIAEICPALRNNSAMA